MLHEERLHVACVLPSLRSMGPGTRIGLWVEGCGLDCPGCMSLALKERRPSSGRRVEEVAEMLVRLAPGHDGLTVSGGEPFDQAEALCRVAEEVKSRTRLDLMIYTGRTFGRLALGRRAQRRLLALTDILVDGPYMKDVPSRKRWKGSANQAVFLGKRGRKYAREMAEERCGPDEMSLHVLAGGGVLVSGIPRPGFMEGLAAGLRSRGIALQAAASGAREKAIEESSPRPDSCASQRRGEEPSRNPDPQAPARGGGTR